MKGMSLFLSIEPWATESYVAILNTLKDAAHSGMPVELVEEVARETARIIYSRAVKVEAPRHVSFVDDCGIVRYW